MAKIGVFDSGVGGKSVANAIQDALPNHVVILREDRENLPYGTKSKEQLIHLVTPILKEMVSSGCDVIVIACNTVTTVCISELREQFDVPLIGIEPMLKPAAALTKTNVIGVLATPGTLRSNRYKQLKKEYCKNVAVLEPDVSVWASLIQENSINRTDIEETITGLLAEKADVIVLGCTHYHWIREEILELSEGKAEVIQPEQPVIHQLKSVLVQLG